MPTARSSDEFGRAETPGLCSIVSSETHVPLECAASFPKLIFARTNKVLRLLACSANDRHATDDDNYCSQCGIRDLETAPSSKNRSIKTVQSSVKSARSYPRRANAGCADQFVHEPKEATSTF